MCVLFLYPPQSNIRVCSHMLKLVSVTGWPPDLEISKYADISCTQELTDVPRIIDRISCSLSLAKTLE